MILPFVMLGPRSEVAKFAVVAIIREPHFGTDEDDLAIVDDDTTIIGDVLVHHWPAERGRHSKSIAPPNITALLTFRCHT